MQAAPPPAVTFTAFDWFLVVIVVVSTVAAFQKGIIRVLLSLGGLIAGIIVASWNYETVAVSLQRGISNIVVCEVVAFLVIFVLVLVLSSFVAHAISKTVRAIGLGFADRLLGAAFGLGRGVLLGIAAMMLAAAFFPKASWLQNSTLGPYFLSGVHAVSFVVPANFQDQISSGAKYLLHETPELLRPHTLGQDN
jgi:membrane protein required for colicin V production